MSRARRIVLTAVIVTGTTLSVVGAANAADTKNTDGNDKDPAPTADACTPAIYGTCQNGAGHVMVPHTPLLDVHSTSGG